MAAEPLPVSPPDPGDSHRGPAVAAAVLFGLAALSEVWRPILAAPWPLLQPLASHTVSVLLVLLWSAAAVGLLRRWRAPAFAKTAWVASLLGTVGLLAHGLVANLLGVPLGLAYTAAGLVAAVLVRRTFDRGEFARLRRALRADARGVAPFGVAPAARPAEPPLRRSVAPPERPADVDARR